MIVSPDFLNHWKTEHLITLTGDEAAPLMLIRLWGHCQQRKRWEFELNPTVLKSICKSKCSGDELLSILKECGFIDVEDQSFRVHDWEEVNASLISSWSNGKKGGRPLSVKKPMGYPQDTHGVTQKEPEDNLLITDKRREDKIRLEKINTGAGKPAGNLIVLELSESSKSPEQQLIEYLNLKTESRFGLNDTNLKLVKARLKECHNDIEGVKQMIDRQCAMWGTDSVMSEYLRPQTLFGKQKFDGYYASRSKPIPQHNNGTHKQSNTGSPRAHLGANAAAVNHY